MILWIALLQVLPAQKFPVLPHPGGSGLAVQVEEVCGTRPRVTREALLAQEGKAAQPIVWHKETAATWDSVACARARLAADNAPTHDGPAMLAGTSWLQGAGYAARRALALQPLNSHAADILSVAAMGQLYPDSIPSLVAHLVAAFRRGDRAPALLRGCTEFATRRGDVATATACADAALATGHDSTWHLVRLAQLAFAISDTTAGIRAFVAAAGAAHDSIPISELSWHLQWFVTPAEQAEFAALADSARGTWVRDHLIARDVRDGEPFGARLAEHFNRLAYAREHFTIHWPQQMQLHGPTAAAPVNTFTPDSIVASCEPAMIPALPFRDYNTWQTGFDDRGVVWLRYGAPTKRVRSPPPVCADSVMYDQDKMLPTNQREVWVYELDGKRLLLNFESEKFTGTTEATRLVTGVLGSYLCDVDAERCALTEKSKAQYLREEASATMARLGGLAPAAPPSGLVHPEQIEDLRQEDQRNIAVATTTDDNSVRGDKLIRMNAMLHRLWDPLSGAPVSMLTYAVAEKDLATELEAGRHVATVNLELRQWDGADWRDTVINRRLAVADTSLARPMLTGFVLMRNSAAVRAWSVVATQPDHRRGRNFDTDTPGLGTGPVALSDIVVGVPRQHLTWNFHNLAIPLTATGVVEAQDTVALYYQVRSSTARSDVRTTVSVFAVTDGVSADTASLQVGYPPEPLERGINETEPSIELSRLKKGFYRIEIRLTDGDGTVLARRSASIELE